MKPSQSYIIWFTQRNGSSVLCKGLESTGIAGKPNELLNLADIEALFEKYESKDPVQIRARLWKEGSTSNHVFGLKYGFYQPYHDHLIHFFRQLPDCPDDAAPWQVWNCLFPASKHIFLTRRNKVRLAVSWWKAIKSGEWHRETGAKASEVDLENAYNFEAINHLFVEASMREAGMQEWLSASGVSPMTIAYEDMILDFEGTVRSIVEFLDISIEEPYNIALPYYSKLADKLSEKWVQQFRKERQKGWTNVGW